jgi:hypothetical protein
MVKDFCVSGNYSLSLFVLVVQIDPQWCHWGFFPRLTTEPCALGSTQPLKMSTRKISGSKAGRCVRLTTYHLLVPNVKKIRGLNIPDPHGPVQACSGTALLYFFYMIESW